VELAFGDRPARKLVQRLLQLRTGKFPHTAIMRQTPVPPEDWSEADAARANF
jgi:hypothetical protein